MSAIAIIPARLAATRLPRKPLRMLAGRPMLAWVYDAVRAVPELADVIIATDSNEILAAAQAHGWNARLTSPQHRSGTERVHEVACAVPGDVYLNVQGDEPLTRPEHITELLHLTSAAATPAARSPPCGTTSISAFTPIANRRSIALSRSLSRSWSAASVWSNCASWKTASPSTWPQRRLTPSGWIRKKICEERKSCFNSKASPEKLRWWCKLGHGNSWSAGVPPAFCWQCATCRRDAGAPRAAPPPNCTITRIARGPPSVATRTEGAKKKTRRSFAAPLRLVPTLTFYVLPFFFGRRPRGVPPAAQPHARSRHCRCPCPRASWP